MPKTNDKAQQLKTIRAIVDGAGVIAVLSGLVQAILQPAIQQADIEEAVEKYMSKKGK